MNVLLSSLFLALALVAVTSIVEFGMNDSYSSFSPSTSPSFGTVETPTSQVPFDVPHFGPSFDDELFYDAMVDSSIATLEISALAFNEGLLFGGHVVCPSSMTVYPLTESSSSFLLESSPTAKEWISVFVGIITMIQICVLLSAIAYHPFAKVEVFHHNDNDRTVDQREEEQEVKQNIVYVGYTGTIAKSAVDFSQELIENQNFLG